jgi:hypothetical protein
MCYSRHTDSLDMSFSPIQETTDEDELVGVKPTHIYRAGEAVFRVDAGPFTWPGVQLADEPPGVPTSMAEVQGLQVETWQLCCQLWLTTARNST